MQDEQWHEEMARNVVDPLHEMVHSGVLTPPRLAASGPPPRPVPVAPLDDILADLDESRRDR